MIINACGGGGLFPTAIVVTAKANLPSSAREGMIGIISSAVTSITDIRISREEPIENISNGTLWITIAMSGAKLFLNSTKKQYMVLGTAKLYDGSAWNEVPIFVKGADGWNSAEKYWFKTASGFLIESSSQGGTQNVAAESFTMRYTDNSVAYRWSTAKIDLSAYSKMHINIKSNTSSSEPFTFGLGTASKTFDIASKAITITTANEYAEYDLDISSADTHDCYMNLRANGGYGGSQPIFTINNIWFT